MKALTKDFKILTDRYQVWSYLSKSDIKSRFRRSKLGILWPIIHQLAFSLGAGIIWANVFHLKPEEFVPFLTIGFAIWGFISASMIEGCGAFVIAHGYIKQLPLPLPIFIFRTLYTQLIYLSIGMLTAFCVLFAYGKLTLIGILAAVPGIGILIFFSYGTIGALAILGLRYRDLQHGLAGLFSLLFVVTPVIYPADVLINKGLGFAIYMNPFASLIEVVRYPILNGELARRDHYIASIFFSGSFVALRFYIDAKWSRYVPFWS